MLHSKTIEFTDKILKSRSTAPENTCYRVVVVSCETMRIQGYIRNWSQQLRGMRKRVRRRYRELSTHEKNIEIITKGSKDGANKGKRAGKRVIVEIGGFG
jgi:hypothetical protein